MKKIALALVAAVVLLLPVSANGTPDQHGKPVVSRVIDWD